MQSIFLHQGVFCHCPFLLDRFINTLEDLFCRCSVGVDELHRGCICMLEPLGTGQAVGDRAEHPIGQVHFAGD